MPKPEDQDDKSKTDDKADPKPESKDGKGDAGDADPEIAALMKDPEAVKALLKAKREANDEAKQRRIKAESDEKKALEEQGKFKELAAKHEAKANDAEARLQQKQIAWAVRFAAMKAGAIDPDDISKLLDLSALKVKDDGETVDGVDEAIAELAKKKPHLFQVADDGKGNVKPDVKPTPRPSLSGIVTKPDDGPMSPRDRIELALAKKK